MASNGHTLAVSDSRDPNRISARRMARSHLSAEAAEIEKQLDALDKKA